jgi:hypothetical protein
MANCPHCGKNIVIAVELRKPETAAPKPARAEGNDVPWPADKVPVMATFSGQVNSSTSKPPTRNDKQGRPPSGPASPEQLQRLGELLNEIDVDQLETGSKELAFVTDMTERFGKYGSKTFVTDGQMRYLEGIWKKQR